MNARAPATPPRIHVRTPNPHVPPDTAAPYGSRRGRSRPLAIAAALSVLSTALPSSEGMATDIYRSTAPDGTVVFSDQPTPEATLVRPDPLVVVPRDVPALPEASERPSPEAARGAAAPRIEVDGRVERVEIASPPPDAVLIDPVGPLVVEIGTAPGSLSASGLRAELLIDGEMVATGRGSSLAVPPPERGAHALQVRLVTADGAVRVRSEEQVLHVRRTLARGMLGPRHPLAPERTDEEQ